ncbi:MAG TPA: right-handed parallel beta-helix repeat-containing protein [Lysobacter sp.]
MLPNLPVIAMAVLLAAAALPALAAGSHDSCKGFIDALPTTISTQGTWCLRKDLSTAMTSGGAITINTNNVTIDCNDFKLGGLAAGPGTNTHGIHAVSRLNITVRNCAVRGFLNGVALVFGGGGHRVVDSRFEQNRFRGIWVEGSGNQVLRNLVLDTGDAALGAIIIGIEASGDVAGNTVDGVVNLSAGQRSEGIRLVGAGAVARDNHIRNLVPGSGTLAYGISAFAPSMTVRDNSIANPAPTSGVGVFGVVDTICMGNAVFKFATPIYNCQDGGGNASN